MGYRENIYYPVAIVAGNHLMHRRFGDTTVLGDICRLPRVYQGIVNDQPSLPSPRMGTALQTSFDLLNLQMGGWTYHSCHVIPVCLQTLLSLFYRRKRVSILCKPRSQDASQG